MGVSINGGTPIAGWLIRDNPTKTDDLGLLPILGNLHMVKYGFGKPPFCKKKIIHLYLYKWALENVFRVYPTSLMDVGG